MNYGTIAYNKVTDIEKYLYNRSKIEENETQANSVVFSLDNTKVILMPGVNVKHIFNFKPYKTGIITGVITFGATFNEPCVFNCDLKFNGNIVYSFVFNKNINGDYTEKERFSYDYKFNYMPDDLSEIEVTFEVSPVYINQRLDPPYINVTDIELTGFIAKTYSTNCLIYEEYNNHAVLMLRHFGCINALEFLSLPINITKSKYSELFCWFNSRRFAMAHCGGNYPYFFRLNKKNELLQVEYNNCKHNQPIYDESIFAGSFLASNVTDFDATTFLDGNAETAFIAFISNGKVYGSLYLAEKSLDPFELPFAGTGFFYVKTSKNSFGRLAIIAENAEGTQIAIAPTKLIKTGNSALDIKEYIKGGEWVR